VPKDSTYMINQLGLLGEKYLEILPGTSTEVLTEGSMLTGENPTSMETIMKMVSGIALKLDSTLTGINDGILNEANKKAIAEALANVAAITATVNNGEGTLGMFLKNKNVYQNLDEMTADLKANPWKLFYRPKNVK
jgi:phospholipid/cholesterol/gamma-HCH transport system substrate-binding protein